MDWLETELPPAITPATRTQLARAAICKHRTPETLDALAHCLEAENKPSEAIAVLEALAAEWPQHPISPIRLAHGYLNADRPQDALAVCARALGSAGEPAPRGLNFAKGMAFIRLKAEEDAEEAFLQEIHQHDRGFEALEALFLLARNTGEPERILDLCARLPARYLAYPGARAYLALGKSLSGDPKAAQSTFDNSLIWQKRADPPPGFATLSAFTAALAAEIRANPNLFTIRSESFLRTRVLGYPNEPALRALIKMLKALAEDYFSFLQDRQALSALPPITGPVKLDIQANILYGDQGQRPHIHKYGLMSGVFHVIVPEEVSSSDEPRGALVFGSSGTLSQDAPGVEIKAVRPAEGMATIFPPHMFHWVLPTGSNHPRIAVAFDVIRG